MEEHAQTQPRSWMVPLIVLIGGSVLCIGIFWGMTREKPSEATLVEQEHKEETSMAYQTSEQTTPKQYTAAPSSQLVSGKTYTATIHTTKGDMVVKLLADEAPKTVNNFVFLAKEGFYKNTVFHRIIQDFMIQGGDPAGNGTGGPGYTFEDEPITREYVRGVLAMANRGPNTNGSQFFIVHNDSPLPKSYVIFGAIEATDSKSLATLDAIATSPVKMSRSGEMSQPEESITVTDIIVEEK